VTGMNTKAGTSRGISGIGEINSCVGSYYRKNSSVARCGLFVARCQTATCRAGVAGRNGRRKTNPNGLTHFLSNGYGRTAQNKPIHVIRLVINGYRHFVPCFRIKCLDAPRRSIKDLRGAPEFSVAAATSISAAPLTIAEGWWAVQVQAMAGGKASERTRNVHLNQ
jgi:hypothetical protein